MADKEEKAVEKVTKEESGGDGDDNVPISSIDTLMTDIEDKAVEKVTKEGPGGDGYTNVPISAIDTLMADREDKAKVTKEGLGGEGYDISTIDSGKKKVESNVPLSAIDRGKKKVEDSDNVPISAIDRGNKKVEDSDAEEVILAGNVMPSQVKKEESSKGDLEKKGGNSKGKEKQNTVKREKKEENAVPTTIESLPDHILHSLFSRVPSKTLVQASIISKRWSVLWKTIPYIEFQYCDFGGDDESYENMMNCVNSILFLRNHCDIHTFRYPPVYHTNPMRFFIQSSGWIRYSLSHNVKVLAVCISMQYSRQIVESIFNNNKLEDLQVDFYKNGPETETLFLKKFHLPKVKSLTLLNLHIDDASLDLIINGCPVLKKLALEDCELSISTIRSSTIECLSVKGESNEPDRFLQTIIAPNMTELSIFEHGIAMRHLKLEGTPLVQTAKIGLECDVMSTNPSDILTGRGRLLNGLTSVQCLELTGAAIPFIVKREFTTYLHFYPKQKRKRSNGPVLGNVRHLVIGDFCLLCYFCELLQMLGSCPNMTRLTLVPLTETDLWCMHQDDELDNLRGPTCQFQKLGTIEFLGCTEISSSLLVNAIKQHSINHLRNVDFKWV